MMRQKTILLVEDESDVRLSYTDALTTVGYNVIVAGDATTGLALAEKHRPKLVLLDITMPGMSGLAMLRLLRATKWGANMKVVMLSNRTSSKDLMTALRSHMTDYYVKSDTSLVALYQIVRDLIGKP